MHLLLLLAMVSSVLGEDVNISPISDGLRIEPGANLVIEEGRWTVLITISDYAQLYDPLVTRPLIRRRRALQAKLRTLRTNLLCTPDPFLTEERFTIWQERLDALLPRDSITITTTASEPSRVKRGWFDLGGSILNKVFGVATENQLRQVQSYLLHSAQATEDIVHSVNDLITVVNQTRIQQKRTLTRVADIEIAVTELYDQSHQQWRHLQQMSLVVAIDESLSLLESWARELNQQYQLQVRIRTALDAGKFNEDICPLDLLKNIAKQARRNHLQPVRWSWYYEHVTIKPLIYQDGSMIFQADLPFVTNDEYLRYTLKTWPVPLNQSGLTLQLQTQKDVALHTTEGYVFEPIQCLGYNPQICQTGPIYTQGHLQSPCPNACTFEK